MLSKAEVPSMSARSETTPPEVPDEEEFVDGASRAVEAAIVGLHARGIATTHLIDGRLVRVHPDGRREDLGVPRRP
jgi:hypothetical protein